MRIAILGSGGREHALAWRFSQDEICSSILVIPGNPGMRNTPKVSLAKCELNDFTKIANLVRNHGVDFVVVGPEAPLAAGIVDYFTKIGIKVVGPKKSMAMLESSKAFSKDFMKRYGIKTADSKIFTEVQKAKDYISHHNDQEHVVKASELAAGKGVIVCHNKEDAKEAVSSLMESNNFSVQSKEIVIERMLRGHEISAFALFDGHSYRFLGVAKDYKRVFENDLGPNTGGMGTYSDLDLNDQNLIDKINDEVFDKVLEGSLSEGTPFTGILFAGLMIDENSNIDVIEFNVRFGDPEAQSLLPRIKGDLSSLFYLSTIGRLDYYHQNLEFENTSAVHVVMCSKNYPGVDGKQICLGEKIQMKDVSEDNSLIFFAGVSEYEGELVNSGGRVLGVTGLGHNREEARKNAYQRLEKIDFNGAFFRGDIGK